MGSPGTGKSLQIIKVCEYIAPTKMYVIDMEDKLEAMLQPTGIPKNMVLQVAFDWEEVKVALELVEKAVKPGDWIAFDRIDLTWPAVQRWYAQEVYHEALADIMIDKVKASEKKNTMLAQRFDKGGWQRINEEHETLMLKILYKSRCNILLTSGIKATGEGILDIYGNIGVIPRGQKELGHQPHSVFLLHQRKTGPKTTVWYATTAKDLPGREYFDSEELYDFALQYLNIYSEKAK